MSILSVIQYSIHPHQIAQWERDVGSVAAKARDSREKIHWICSQSITGEIGSYTVALPGESMAEAAGRDPLPVLLQRLFGSQRGLELMTSMGSCLKSVRAQVMRDRPELSYPSARSELPGHFLIHRATVRPGQQDEAEELIRKIAEAVPKVDDPRRFTVWQPVLGDLQAIASARPLFDLAELDQSLPAPDLLVQAFGPAEGGLIYRTGSQAMQTLEAELLVLREDLSHPLLN